MTNGRLSLSGLSLKPPVMSREKPFFRGAFKRTRCIIPALGYYEWLATPEGKQPYYFTARDGSPVLSIAGLWDEWKCRDGRGAEILRDDRSLRLNLKDLTALGSRERELVVVYLNDVIAGR